MLYTTADARQQLLDELADATDEISSALASLGEAYELVDEQTAERLEDELFRPVQIAYGRAQRTHAGFAERHSLPARQFTPATPGAPSHGVSAPALVSGVPGPAPIRPACPRRETGRS